MDQNMRLLLSTLALRSGSIPDTAVQNLIAQSGFDPNDFSNLSREDVFAKISETNPALALIAQQMTQSRENLDDDAGFSDEEEDNAKSNRRRLAAKKLRKRIEAMIDELCLLRERNDALALALGACYLCWGKDPKCEVCNGEGRPGGFEPDKKSFSELVIPALKRFRLSSTRADRKDEITNSNPEMVSGKDSN